MKAQFMLISAIIVGILLVSLASNINDAKNIDYSNNRLSNQAEQLRQIIKEADETEPSNRRRLRRLVSQLPYTTQLNYNGSCFNVTIEDNRKLRRLKCIS